LHAASKTVDPNELISLISEEYDHGVSQRLWRLATKSSKIDDKDEAMSALSSGKVKHQCKPRSVCWNCGEKGHFKDKCPKPLKDAKNNSPKKGSSAHTAVESDSEDGAAVFAECQWESEDVATISVPDSDVDYIYELDGGSDGDWFSEVSDNEGSGWESEELFEADGSECGSLVSVDLNSVASDLEEAAANIIAGSVTDHAPHVEVYDSGCTRHITPYRNAVENFVKIPPKSFRAANKQSFKAVRTGEMTIDVPNGANILQLRLTEVLYSPEVGYMLVSVSRLDDKGFSMTFSGGKCTIKGPDGKGVGTVPKNGNSLYKVAHERDEVNVATEVLTLDQFHRATFPLKSHKSSSIRAL
jgi:Zinc knuckle